MILDQMQRTSRRTPHRDKGHPAHRILLRITTINDVIILLLVLQCNQSDSGIKLKKKNMKIEEC